MSAPDLATLTDNGSTLDLEDGRKLRVLIASDDINPFDEYECYGKVSSVHHNRDRDERPRDFNGNAEKLWASGDQYWWQPPNDVKRSDPEFRKFRSLVIDLLAFGMTYVALEVLQGEDAYHQPIVVKVAGLGGIDSLGNGYLEEVLGDLYAEVMA